MKFAFVYSHFYVLCLGFLGAGILFQIIAVASTHWSEIDQDPPLHSGLWKSCAEFLSQTKCRTPHDTHDWIIATRAFAISGLLFAAFTALCLTVLSHRAFSSNQVWFILAVFGTFTAGLLTIISTIVYGEKFDDTSGVTEDLGWSFILSVAAGVIFIVCGVLLILRKKIHFQIDDDDDDDSVTVVDKETLTSL